MMKIWPHTPAGSRCSSSAFFLLLTNTARTHKAFAWADQYGCMCCWVWTGSTVEAGAAEKENSYQRRVTMLMMTGLYRHLHLNKFTPTHAVHVLYTVHVTPILHTDMYRSLNAALKAAISPLRAPAEKSLELELAEGSPPHTACHSSPESSEFPHSD